MKHFNFSVDLKGINSKRATRKFCELQGLEPPSYQFLFDEVGGAGGFAKGDREENMMEEA
ncbi:hypothetical protein MYX82_03790 [Acidobacteria bacterium AH-259-D05]|nr:hypothetical protein [Acidobacteria bacterium AH-259-D05]